MATIRKQNVTYYTNDMDQQTRIGENGSGKATLLSEITNLAYPVRMYRVAAGHGHKACFAVQYGCEIMSNLDSFEAADEFGTSMLHALHCMGMID